MNQKIQVYLPDIGDYKDVPVVELLVGPGDDITIEQPLITVESDKATMEIPSPVAGKVIEMVAVIGAKVSKGTLLLTIETSGNMPATIQAEPVPAIAAPTIIPAPDLPPVPPSTGIPAGRGHATPSVRGFARELGIDLARVRPSGPKGRILREDVIAFVKPQVSGEAGPASGVGAGLPAWPSVDYAKFGPVTREPLSRIQKLSGANLTRNWLTIPHVTNFDRADVSGLEEFRNEINASRKDVKLTMVAFLIKASALALRAYPRFNSALEGDELVLKDYVHVGFAADTPKGLMVPVIRDCDRKGVGEIASEMRALADQARGGALPGTAMQGGCFSVSSLGGVGGAGFTPIINAPEVAILGAGRSAIEPIWNGSAFEPRQILPMSLSWDHRVVDGVAAARFLGHIAALLTDFRRAII